MPDPKRDSFVVMGLAEAGIPATRLESLDEIRRATQAPRVPTQKEEQAAEPETVAFRPVLRPPMAVLTVLDDGGEDGERIRLRQDVTVIGRTEGDIRIPHDTAMSGRHAAIQRESAKGRYRWVLVDLDSTNGTFVRASSTVMKHGQEIMIGGRRYRFDAAQAGAAAMAAAVTVDANQPAGTRGWQTVKTSDLIPSLVELSSQGKEGQRLLLNQQENWIGRDLNQCSVTLVNDMLVSPRHARLYRDEKGLWHLDNAGSRNGTWIRVTKMALDGVGMFQLGEQRFLLKTL